MNGRNRLQHLTLASHGGPKEVGVAINGEAVQLQAGIYSAITYIVTIDRLDEHAAQALGRRWGFTAGAWGACLWLMGGAPQQPDVMVCAWTHQVLA